MSEFPEDLSLAIKGLDNKHRQKIVLMLSEDEKLSFSEIKEKLQLKRSLLASHLKKLTRNLLIEHYYEHEIGNENYSFYSLSSYGRNLLANMLGALYFNNFPCETKFVIFEFQSTNTPSNSQQQLETNINTSTSEAVNDETEKPLLMVR